MFWHPKGLRTALYNGYTKVVIFRLPIDVGSSREAVWSALKQVLCSGDGVMSSSTTRMRAHQAVMTVTEDTNNRLVFRKMPKEEIIYDGDWMSFLRLAS